MTNALIGRNNRVPTELILGISAAMLVSLAAAVPSGAATRYVNVSNASPSPPYTTWISAANVIQDAVDLAQPGDEIVVMMEMVTTTKMTIEDSPLNSTPATVCYCGRRSLVCQKQGGERVKRVMSDQISRPPVKNESDGAEP